MFGGAVPQTPSPAFAGQYVNHRACRRFPEPSKSFYVRALCREVQRFTTALLA